MHHDKWTALRQKPADLGGIRMRRRRAQAISQFAGIGYSPRVVALAGLMLRALVKCFRAPLEPSIGFGVGTKLAARYAHREWLPCLVLGWYAGGPLWDAVRKSKFYGAFVLNHRVVLHAIDATPARWRGDAGSSPLDRARTAASSPRNDFVKNCRVPDSLVDFHTAGTR